MIIVIQVLLKTDDINLAINRVYYRTIAISYIYKAFEFTLVQNNIELSMKKIYLGLDYDNIIHSVITVLVYYTPFTS